VSVPANDLPVLDPIANGVLVVLCGRAAKASEFAKSIGLTVNSGHGINYQNVGELLQVADFNELNIGHTIISRALYVGIEKAVAEMKSLLK